MAYRTGQIDPNYTPAQPEFDTHAAGPGLSALVTNHIVLRISEIAARSA